MREDTWNGLRDNFGIEPSTDTDVHYQYFLEWPGSQATLQSDGFYKLLWTSSMGSTPYSFGPNTFIGDDVNCAYNGTLYHLKIELRQPYIGDEDPYGFLKMSGVGSLNTLQILNLLTNYPTTSSVIVDRRREFYYTYNDRAGSSTSIHLQYNMDGPEYVQNDAFNENNTGILAIIGGSYPFNSRSDGGTNPDTDSRRKRLPRWNHEDGAVGVEDGQSGAPYGTNDAVTIARLIEDSDYNPNHNFRDSSLYTQDSIDSNYILLKGNLPIYYSTLNSSQVITPTSQLRMGKNIHVLMGGSLRGQMQDSSGNKTRTGRSYNSDEPYTGGSTLNNCNIIHGFDFYDKIGIYDNDAPVPGDHGGGNGGYSAIDSNAFFVRTDGNTGNFNLYNGQYAGLEGLDYQKLGTGIVDLTLYNSSYYKGQSTSMDHCNDVGFDIAAFGMGSFYKNWNKRNFQRFYYTVALICYETYGDGKQIANIIPAPGRFIDRGQIERFVYGYGCGYLHHGNGYWYTNSRELGAPYSHSGGNAGTTLTLNFSNEGAMGKPNLTTLDFGDGDGIRYNSRAGPYNQVAMMDDYDLIVVTRTTDLFPITKMFRFGGGSSDFTATGTSNNRLTITVAIPSNRGNAISAYLSKSRRCQDRVNHEA